MTLVAHIDFETASATELKKSGVYRYAECQSTKPWGFAWRLGLDGSVLQWRPGYPDPVALLDHIARGGAVVAHNAAFERRIWNGVLRPRYAPHWPELRTEQLSCTMARAFALRLPGTLDKLGEVLSIANAKDKEGHAIMMKMARPRGVDSAGRFTWWDEPWRVDRLMQYCEQDVRAETDADVKLPPLSPEEQRLWCFDQLINDRGVRIDLPTVQRMTQLTDIAKKAADREMRKITAGAVRKVTEVGKLAEWLRNRGIDCETIRKGDIDDLIFKSQIIDDKAAEDAITLRRSASKSSVAKYAAMVAAACADWRVRGLLQYHGAGTGRWAGRLIQPQNLARFNHEDPREVAGVLYLIDLLNSDMSIQDVYETMDMAYGDVLHFMSKALRSMFIASPGKKLVGGDYSNIEGRMNAWLAGEDWKIAAFREYDDGTGPDLYKLAFSKSFGIGVADVNKSQRQIGKVQELALGYQGSIGAFLTMGANYGVDPYAISRVVIPTTPTAQYDALAQKYHTKGTNRYELQEREWVALKVVVDGWRSGHPNVVQSWWDYQDAAIEAVENIGEAIPVGGNMGVAGRVRYMSDGNFLYCQLPSRRVISYPQPELHVTEEEAVNRKGETYIRRKRSVSFYGLDDRNQWTKQYLYGGMQCENVVQAAARDVMVEGMYRVEAAGYPVILTVHDEALSEVDEGFGSADDYAAHMSVLPSWAHGLPLAAAAWEDKRYVK